MQLSELLEIGMIVLFGCSWPMNVIKSYKVRTAKGKSLAFLLFIWIGYICGISSKLVIRHGGGTVKWYVLFFYVLNFVMVSLDLILYFRNKRLDKVNGVQ